MIENKQFIIFRNISGNERSILLHQPTMPANLMLEHLLKELTSEGLYIKLISTYEQYMLFRKDQIEAIIIEDLP